MDDIEPKRHKCLLKDVYFYGLFGYGILEKLGPDAFKDKRRFPNDEDVLCKGMKVIFDARRDFVSVKNGAEDLDNSTILINDDCIYKPKD